MCQIESDIVCDEVLCKEEICDQKTTNIGTMHKPRVPLFDFFVPLPPFCVPVRQNVIPPQQPRGLSADPPPFLKNNIHIQIDMTNLKK